MFPHLTRLDPEWGAKMPLFIMAPGAVATFSGSDLCHGTTEHDAVQTRPAGCLAHVSFAVQTPAATLGLVRTSAECVALHKSLLAATNADVCRTKGHWSVQAGTAWLGVRHMANAMPPPHHLRWEPKTMAALPFERIVLFDTASEAVLVAYDARGGLRRAQRAEARANFEFLHQFEFRLCRQPRSGVLGALGLDARGGQRMLMLGLRAQAYGNCHPDGKAAAGSKRRRGKRRRSVEVAHPEGDLDAYIDHFSDPQCAPALLKPTWEALAGRMRALLPSTCARLAAELEVRNVRQRVYSATGLAVVSEDLIVNNVGASAGYCSPSHFDRRDVGPTFAFAVKCPRCGRRGRCTSVEPWPTPTPGDTPPGG